MRCNNCGWENQDGAQVCIKCNTLLGKTISEVRKPAIEHSDFGKTITDMPSLPGVQKDNRVFEKTVRDSIAAKLPVNDDIQKDILVSCPNTECGYLNPVDAVVCARCKTGMSISFTNHSSTLHDTNKIHAGPTTINNQKQAINPAFKSTIDPYRKNISTHTCHFTPVFRMGELKEPVNATLPLRGAYDKKFEIGDDPVELRRENLDKDNTTITTKVQAELSFEAGKWYLLDRSELNTTFIHVKRKMELNEGDIVLMGDRKFAFSTVDKSKWT